MSEAKTGLERLNDMRVADAEAEMFRCCGASRWASQMAAARPFGDINAVIQASEALWPDLSEEDWRKAFTHHPKIGDIEGLRSRFADTRVWAAGEQSGSEAASEQILQALAAANAAYEKKFSYIFIVCATGKSAGEMLALLQARLGNEPALELAVAAAEQKKITRLRLEKLLGGVS